jgi:hypothetical protein
MFQFVKKLFLNKPLEPTLENVLHLLLDDRREDAAVMLRTVILQKARMIHEEMRANGKLTDKMDVPFDDIPSEIVVKHYGVLFNYERMLSLD